MLSPWESSTLCPCPTCTAGRHAAHLDACVQACRSNLYLGFRRRQRDMQHAHVRRVGTLQRLAADPGHPKAIHITVFRRQLRQLQPCGRRLVALSEATTSSLLYIPSLDVSPAVKISGLKTYTAAALPPSTCCGPVDAAEGCKLSVSTGLTAGDSAAEAPPKAATVAVSSCCTSDLQDRRRIQAAAVMTAHAPYCIAAPVSGADVETQIPPEPCSVMWKARSK